MEPALVDECSMNKASGAVKAEKNLTYKAIVCEDLRDRGFIILERSEIYQGFGSHHSLGLLASWWFSSYLHLRMPNL